MSQVLVDQLRVLAHRLGGSNAGRQDSTRRFWLIARQLRASLPPLLLASRTGSSQRRVGYLLLIDREPEALVNRLRDEHAAAGDSVCLYVRGDFRALLAGWAKIIDLNPLSEIQAARAIAEDDLDVLADPGGRVLKSMPLLIALHPARRIIEPAFVPAVSGGQTAFDGNTTGVEDAVMLIRVVRETLDSLPSVAGEHGHSPAALNARLNRGIQLHQAGQLTAACGVYEDVLAQCPQHAIAAYLLGQLLHQQDENERAVQWLQIATGAAPEFRDAHYTLAQRLFDLERWHEAVAAYRRSLDLTPGFAAGWSGLGLAGLHTGDSSGRASIGHLERAVALEPGVSQWSFNLGSGLQRTGDLTAAREAYRRAVELEPDHLEAHFNLAALAHELGEFGPAIDGYRGVLERKPDFEAAYMQLGAALLQAGRVEEWLDNYQQYRAQCGESLSLAVYGLEASMAAGDTTAHASWCQRILAGAFQPADPGDFTRNWEQLLFLLLHVDVDRERLLQWYRRYDASARDWYGSAIAMPRARRPGPLRIGYLSGDFRDHVMGRMIFGLASHHDISRFRPHLYSLSLAGDEWTDRFRALGFPFVQLAGMLHETAASRIREDDLDVLIDCSGHTRGAQQGILALKPARIVVTHIATPGPVGLRSIDYKLTDAYAESEDAQEFVIERLWPVDGGVFPWHRYPTPIPFSRDSAGIPAEAFVCGAFVSIMKLSPRCLGLWRRILDRLPHAVLALSPAGEDWNPSYLRWLGANGIPAERVVFVPYRKDESAALARYRVLDVVLDPLPCGNVNGTMEALACGVPVVTLVGRRHGERLGNALLRRFGVCDTIAGDESEYIQFVCRLATDSEWRDDLRSRIREAAARSPVWHVEDYTRGLEGALEQMTAAHLYCAVD